MEYKELAESMVKGAVEIHVHSFPDVFPRLLNDIELARQAKDAGMSAVLIKNHFGCTVARAGLTAYVTDFPVFGGIALNHSVGGLNPHAVRVSIEMGAKKVWMPTLHAEYYLRTPEACPMFGPQIQGITGLRILNDDSTLKDEVLEILDLIAAADIALGTGHISPEEAMVLAERAKSAGVKKIVVTHPTSPMMRYTIEQMKETLARGACMLEHVYGDTTGQMMDPIAPCVISDAIRATGVEHNIMSTDTGQAINPPPVAAMALFIQMMLEEGLGEEDIRVMTRGNPAQILGLDLR
ncbi:MAG: DUF6282 family protein [Oscillospiraceae bacterium]|nr:DUF6282 family protein [Oscillospiraceae bacterium]